MYTSSSSAALLSLQVPQVIAVTYFASLVLGELVLRFGRAHRDCRGPSRVARFLGLGALILVALVVPALLVAIVAYLLPGAVPKTVVIGTSAALIVSAVVYAWPLRRRTLNWLRESPATHTIPEQRLQVLVDRHTLYSLGSGGLMLTFAVIGVGTVTHMLLDLGHMRDAEILGSYFLVFGAGVVLAMGVEVFRRLFPDAVLITAYRRGAWTKRLVDLCDRCLSREIAQAPVTLRGPYQASAEKTLAAMATALHRTEGDTEAVRLAVHDALEPALSLGGHEVRHRLGSGTPSVRVELTVLVSGLAAVATIVGALQVFVGLLGPILV